MIIHTTISIQSVHVFLDFKIRLEQLSILI